MPPTPLSEADQNLGNSSLVGAVPVIASTPPVTSPLSPFSVLTENKHDEMVSQPLPSPAVGLASQPVVNNLPINEVPLPPVSVPSSPMVNNAPPITNGNSTLPPVGTEVDREELIKQAAQAPTHTFILPQSPTIETTTPSFRVTPPVAKPAFTPTPPAPVLSPPPSETAPIASASTARILTMTPAPTSHTPPPVPPLHDNVQMKLGEVGAGSKPAPHRSGSKIAAAAGVLIGLGIIAGAMYGLALNGMRIPILYPYVSGISGDGITVAKNAATALASTASYEVIGGMSIKRIAQSGTPKPALPDSGTAPDPTANFAGIKGTVAVPDQMLFNSKDTTYTGKIRLAQEGATEVPIILHETPKDKNVIYFKLPASLGVTASTAADGLKNTLLYSVLRPISLPVLLSGAQSEQKYRKVLVNGKEAANYRYALDKTVLQDSLPKGAALTNPTVEITYNWHNGQPLISDFDSTLTYLGRNYQYSQHVEYSNWGIALASASLENQQVASASVAISATALSTADFIGQLGVVSFVALPHGSTNGISITPVPSPTPSVSPSANPTSSPVVSPSPSVIALVSSGLSTAVVLPSKTVIPAIPSLTAAGTARDGQRKKDLTDLQTALENYKTKLGKYPASSGIEQVQSSAVLFQALVPSYLSKMPIDPLKDTFWYEYSSDGATYTLHSVAENPADSLAHKGVAFSYYEFQNK